MTVTIHKAETCDNMTLRTGHLCTDNEIPNSISRPPSFRTEMSFKTSVEYKFESPRLPENSITSQTNKFNLE